MRKFLMSQKNGLSYSLCHWILGLGSIALCISLLSGCVDNNPPGTPSTKAETIAAAELAPLKSESVPEPEPVFEMVTEPTAEPELVAEPELIAEPEQTSGNVNEQEAEPELIIEPEPVSDNVTEPTAEPELIAEPEPVPENIAEPTSQPELATEPEPETEPILIAKKYQDFGYNMEKSRLSYGKRVFCHLSISKELTPGEAVSGYVEFTDPQMVTYDEDYGYGWELEVLDPDGEEIYSRSGNYGSNSGRKFFIRALDHGEYIVNVGHYSTHEKILFLKISPTEWTIEHVDGDDISDE